MRILCIVFFFVMIGVQLTAQDNYPNEKFPVLPYKYNSFVNNPAISWACEMYNVLAFDSIQGKLDDIYSYLINAKKEGNIKTYVTKEFIIPGLKQWVKPGLQDYYIEVDKKYNLQNTLLPDSSKSIKFHQVFYIVNHVLQSHIISAGPEFPVTTSTGIYLGKAVPSFSSLHMYPDKKSNKKETVIFLGTKYSSINFDSIEMATGIKKMYGMSAASVLWYDLSQGFNKVIDVKYNKRIPPSEVWKYSLVDSVSAYLSIDPTTLPLKSTVAGPPAYNYFTNIGIYQHWYYNKTRDIFFNKISKAMLFVKYKDDSGQEVIEKRFEIDF